MNNPYNAPIADLSQPVGDAATYVPAFFSLTGRLGRARYVAYLMGAIILLSLGVAPVGILMASMGKRSSSLATFLPLLTTAATFIIWMLIARRRLNDMNRTGWLSLVLIIPLVNLGVSLWLLFGPGGKGANKHGLPPCKNSTGVIIACVAASVMAIVLILTSAATAYTAYKLAGLGITGTPPTYTHPR